MGTVPLVGRDEPSRRLARLVDEAVAGVGRLVLISGEPGIGKSRLALAALDDAAGRGARTAVGVCWDGAGAPGLWPWVQVLRSLRASLDDGEWRGACGTGFDALRQLLDGEAPSSAAEFHLFEATLEVLANLADDRPLVVLLDDLQWADAASLTLAGFVLRHASHLPLLVLATCRADELARSDHPHREAIASLAEKAVTVPLHGLDNQAITELRDHLGVSTSAAEAEHLRRLTGGNPFFVIESVAFTDPTESLGVRRAIDRRLDALSRTEREALTVAAVLGPEAPDRLVAAVVGADLTPTWTAIEQAGLMRREGSGHAFLHDLVRETLRDRLTPDEARSLRALVVDAAEAIGPERPLLPSQLASIAVAAVPDIAFERAIAWCEVAAEDATARLTYEAAAGHYDQAARLAEGDERVRLTLLGADAHHRAGALATARERYAELLRGTDVRTRARAALGLHRLGDPAAVGHTSGLGEVLDGLDAELDGDADIPLRAEVRAARSQAQVHALADERTAAAPLAEEALALARASGDRPTIAACLLAHHDAIWEPGTEVTRRELAGELAAIGHASSDPIVEAQGLLLRMVAEIELGDRAFVDTHRRFDAVSEGSHSPRLQFVAASRRGTIAVLHGDLSRAVAEIDAARALGERIGDPDAVGVWCDQRWQVATHTGDRDAISELVGVLRTQGDPHWMIYEAMLAEDAAEARRHEAEVDRLIRQWPRWAARLWDTFCARLAILEGDESKTAALVDRMRPDADAWAVLGGGVLVDGPFSLWLGRLEAAREHWVEAHRWSSAAEAAAVRMEATLWVVEAGADRLVAEQATGRADAREVASMLAAARDRGLAPTVERLQRLVPTEAPAVAANAFRRERDVWTLVFDGVEVRMPDTKGLRDLHTLLANPRVEVPATALASDGLVVGEAAPPVLDSTAKSAYRRRLDELDEELDRAGRRGDGARAERLEAERTALLDELRRAAGLGGRDRSIGGDRERMRKTVTARIRDTLGKLDDRHPALAAHLRASVRTGARCAYEPAAPVAWDLAET